LEKYYDTYAYEFELKNVCYYSKKGENFKNYIEKTTANIKFVLNNVLLRLQIT